VEGSCKSMMQQANAQAFDLNSLILPPNTHLLFYGHSYLWESFHMIRLAHKLVMGPDGLSLIKGPPSLLCGNDDAECMGHQGCICAGGAKQKGMPYCGGASNFNCDCNKGVRYSFKTGSTITGIFNWEAFQRQRNADQLKKFIDAGVDGVPYTHAFVMEPHPELFYDKPNLVTMRSDSAYGCGWSADFWNLWNAAMPGKVHHVVPWGYTGAALTYAHSAPPAVELSARATNCTCESPNYEKPTTASLFSSGGIQGHQCIAARDDKGVYLGVVALMAADILRSGPGMQSAPLQRGPPPQRL